MRYVGQCTVSIHVCPYLLHSLLTGCAHVPNNFEVVSITFSGFHAIDSYGVGNVFFLAFQMNSGRAFTLDVIEERNGAEIEREVDDGGDSAGVNGRRNRLVHRMHIFLDSLACYLYMLEYEKGILAV